MAIARRANAAFNRGDVDAALERFAPDAELQDLLNAPDQSIRVQGVEAIRETWTLWIDAFDELRADVDEYIDAGSTVIGAVHWHGQGKASGVSIDMHQFDAYEFRDGTIIRVSLGFRSRAEALEAVGLSEEATSQENVESVLRGVDAFNRRDVEAFAALGTPDVEVVPMRAAVEAISYRGPEGVAQFFAETDEIWDAISVELSERPTQVDDRTIYASGRLRGRGHDSGIDVDMEVAWVFRFRDGLISSSRTYADVARAREDAGLSE